MKGIEYATEEGEALSAEAIETGTLSEAISALTVLGYSKMDAAAALANASPDATVEDLIKSGLKKLATKL